MEYPLLAPTAELKYSAVPKTFRCFGCEGLRSIRVLGLARSRVTNHKKVDSDSTTQLTTRHGPASSVGARVTANTVVLYFELRHTAMYFKSTSR